MSNRAAEKVLLVLLVCVIGTVVLMVRRLSRIEPGALVLPMSPKEAAETYEQRIRATERLLVTDRL